MSESFLGSGRLLIDRLTDAGVSTGYKVVGGCPKFELHMESEIKEQRSKGRNNYGQVIASATLPGKTNLAITINDLDAENMAMAFMGTKSADNQTAGTVTDEEVVAHPGYASELEYEAVSSVVVKDDTDTTTFVEDTDYTVDARLGLITVLAAGNISEGDTLHVDYSYADVTRDKVVGADAPIIRCKLILDGKNMVNGRDVRVIVPKARLKPSSAVDFLSDDFLPLELEGLCEIPAVGEAPFEIIYLG